MPSFKHIYKHNYDINVSKTKPKNSRFSNQRRKKKREEERRNNLSQNKSDFRRIYPRKRKKEQKEGGRKIRHISHGYRRLPDSVPVSFPLPRISCFFFLSTIVIFLRFFRLFSFFFFLFTNPYPLSAFSNSLWFPSSISNVSRNIFEINFVAVLPIS